MATFRTLVLTVIFGAFLGIVAATFSADALISTDLCGITSDELTSRPCLDTVHTTVAKVIRIQQVGAAVGGILGLIVGILWIRRGSTKAMSNTPGAA